MNPEPTHVSEAEQSQVNVKEAKAKKPRTDAQKAATAKALAAMTARRKEMIEQRKEKKEEVKKAKKIVEEKIIKEDIGFVMKNDFDALKKELYELRGLMSAQQQQQQVKPPIPATKQERIVERIIEKAPTPIPQPQKLTGHALLDKLFFEK